MKNKSNQFFLSKLCCVLFFILLFGCHNKKYKAYRNFVAPSSQGGDYGRSGPYSITTQNNLYRLESYPFKHVSTILGDFCSGITKVYQHRTDSLIYSIDRYFGIDNTFLSNNGRIIAYVNNYWRGSDFDSCSNNILEFYRDGSLDSEFTYFQLLGEDPKEEDWSWLINESKNKWLGVNNHFQYHDELYLIPRRTGSVFIFDMETGKFKEKIDTSFFLNNLEMVEYSPGNIEFFPIQEVKGLPGLKGGMNFRQGLSEVLNVEIINTDKIQETGRYYFRLEVEGWIDDGGNIVDNKTYINDNVLSETSTYIKNETQNFLSESQFNIDSLPYGMSYWFFKDYFYLTRKPRYLSERDLKEYSRRVCLIDSFNGVYIPKNLSEAHLELDNLLNDTTKVAIKNGESSHFGVGLWIRNNWGLWGGGRLSCFFEERELYHPDNISSLIIYTYQMRLNNHSFDSEAIIKEYAREEKDWFGS